MADSYRHVAARTMPAVVVTMPAEIDVRNAPGLSRGLAAALSPGAVLIIDMSGTVFCDSSGIRMLVVAHRQAAGRDTEVRLVVTSPAVLAVLSLMGVDRLLQVHTSLDEALTSTPQDPA